MTSENDGFEFERMTASDWDGRDTYDIVISDDYKSRIFEKAAAGGWDCKDFEPNVPGELLTVVDEVELHPYSMLVVGKFDRQYVVPVCRPTDGHFIMVGPEVMAMFAAKDYLEAYVVWERLQFVDLMHHIPRKLGVWDSGSRGVTLDELLKFFPTKKRPWIRKQLKRIEETTGMLKEARTKDVNNTSAGYAFFPFLTYHPFQRLYLGVDRYNWSLSNLQHKRVKQKPKGKRKKEAKADLPVVTTEINSSTHTDSVQNHYEMKKETSSSVQNYAQSEIPIPTWMSE